MEIPKKYICCLGCLTNVSEITLQSYIVQNENIKSIFQADSIYLCYLCKRIAQKVEMFIQNVQSNQILLENFQNTMDSTFQLVRMQIQPLVNLNKSAPIRITLSGDKTDDVVDKFTILENCIEQEVKIKLEMKEEEGYLHDHLEGEFLDDDEFQESCDVKDENDFFLRALVKEEVKIEHNFKINQSRKSVKKNSKKDESQEKITKEKAEEEEEDGEEYVIDVSPPSSFIHDPEHLLGTLRAAKRAQGPSTSSLEAPPLAKIQKMLLSPSTGVLQASVSPQTHDPVFEFQGFTPSSTTSTMPGSGRSGKAYEIGVDVDIEGDLEDDLDVNAGSDIDADTDFVENLMRQRDVFEYPGAFDAAEDPGLIEALEEIDTQADVALRELTESDDYLNFDWRVEADNFRGVREEFVGPSGPTFDTAGLTPLDILKKIWDADIIAHIVRETNNLARQLQQKSNSKPNSRLSRWRDTTEDEIWRVLGIMMLQSLVINNVEREYWYPRLEQLRFGAFGDIMPFNRFLLLKRCLHFVDNASLPENISKLHKIMPVVEHLNKQFSSLYLPEQNVAIDESLLLWQGRLSFAQLIATKSARIGIKSFELCESRTGYLWKMEVYTGKGHVHEPQEVAQEGVSHNTKDEPESATSQIVFNLMRPLFNRGHTLVMDNFYNAPLLSRLLKAKHKTDTMGPLRLNREFVPDALKGKNKKNMNAGEICLSTTQDLSIIVWMDKSPVHMISTYHEVKVGGKEKCGYYKYKPQVVLDYNLSMGGIDHKDQMLHAFPVERVRNITWYKKLFRRLLNVSIHNALVIFTHNKKMGNRAFRLFLAQEILQVHGPQLQSVPRPLAPAPAPTPAPAAPSGLVLHMPVKTVRPQRCKVCSIAKVRHETIWTCGTCKVHLCLKGCYNTYHNG